MLLLPPSRGVCQLDTILVKGNCEEESGAAHPAQPSENWSHVKKCSSVHTRAGGTKEKEREGKRE